MKKRRGQMMGYTLRHGGLLRGGYLGRGGGTERGKEKVQIKIFRPNNWGYGMGDN